MTAGATGSSAVISVVTPFYNSAATLRRAIDSVLGQTCGGFEYILADNRSTDGSTGIARVAASSDARIRHVRFDDHLPQQANYNRALRLMSPGARYCKIVQADDYLLPRCLEHMLDLGLRHPEVGVIGAFRLVEGRVDPPPDLSLAEVTSGRDTCRATIRGELYAFGSPTSVMYRSDLVRSRRDFFDVNAFFDDTDAVMELLRYSDFGFVHDVLSHTSRDPDSTLGRVISFDISLLHRLVAVQRLGSAYFDRAELSAIRDELQSAYYEQVARSALRRSDRGPYLSFHQKVLHDSAGMRIDLLKLLRATGRLAGRSAIGRLGRLGRLISAAR